jgi:HD-like signal output (HDOD) protein
LIQCHMDKGNAFATKPVNLAVQQERAEKSLDQLTAGLELPHLTGVGAELLSIMHRPVSEVDLRHVATLAESDPSLTLAVLRTANSAYFGALREITTVTQAIIRIGLEDTVRILTYDCLRELVPCTRALPHFNTKRFWMHSWAAATAARLLGKPQYLIRTKAGELYTAGLLHDIGKIVFASRSGDLFDQACALATERAVPVQSAEMEVFGLDHAMVGGKVLDSWNLPVTILEAVRCHHEPARSKFDAREIAMLIELADAIAHHLGFGDGTGQPARDPMQCMIMRYTALPLADPKVLQKAIDEIAADLSDKSQIMQGRQQLYPKKTQSRQAHAHPGKGTDHSSRKPRLPRKGFLSQLLSWIRIRASR